jgi:class 3 adenylate cyclase
MTEDAIEQMLELAERLRAANGGELDDSAILAVSEATGAPVDHVRLAIRIRSEHQKRSGIGKMRAQFLSLDPDVRRYVSVGVAAAIAAILTGFGIRTGSASYGLFGMFALAVAAVGLVTVATARDLKVAAISGAIAGGGYWFATAVASLLLQLNIRIEAVILIPCVLLGALVGIGLNAITQSVRKRFGWKDPTSDRQELLRQLVSLQEKLKSGEQSVTYLSVDMVGSTRMKEVSDPLAVEFTFNEYHQFVEWVAKKHGGRVHSTAGDGAICAFEHPQQAFAAGKNLQTGVMELNTFRNKIGIPIVLRCGIHTGTVLAPTVGDATSVNFAHVIDIAAHIQKVCPEGSVAVSEAAAIYLPGGLDGIGSLRVTAMNVGAAVWQPRMVRSISPSNSTQLAPESA